MGRSCDKAHIFTISGRGKGENETFSIDRTQPDSGCAAEKIRIVNAMGETAFRKGGQAGTMKILPPDDAAVKFSARIITRTCRFEFQGVFPGGLRTSKF